MPFAGVELLSEKDGVADVFLWDVPYRITEAQAYFMLKHLCEWFGLTRTLSPIQLAEWDDWDSLGDRLSDRWGRFLWHPSHWETYYATLPERPASTPGATPRRMAEIRAQLRREKDLQDLKDREEQPQYVLL